MLKPIYILLMVGISLIPLYLGFHAQDGRLLYAIGLIMLIASFIATLVLVMEEKDV